MYAAKVLPLTGESDPRDNCRTIGRVEVIERKNRVLIVAGGPTREYQFVRNLLYRDRDVESHVLLQTGTALSSQEAQELMTEFPADRSELAAIRRRTVALMPIGPRSPTAASKPWNNGSPNKRAGF